MAASKTLNSRGAGPRHEELLIALHKFTTVINRQHHEMDSPSVQENNSQRGLLWSTFEQTIVVEIGSWAGKLLCHRNEHTSHGIRITPKNKNPPKNTFLYFPWARVSGIVIIFSFTSFFH